MGQEELWGVMSMSLSSLGWWLHGCRNVSELFKLCTSNICRRLLHVNFTSIKLFFKECDDTIITPRIKLVLLEWYD